MKNWMRCISWSLNAMAKIYLWALATIIEWTHLSLVLSYTPNPNPNVQLCNHGMQLKRKGKGSMYYLFSYPLHFNSSLFSFSRMSFFPYLLFFKLSKPSFIHLYTLLYDFNPFFIENWVSYGSSNFGPIYQTQVDPCRTFYFFLFISLFHLWLIWSITLISLWYMSKI